MILTMISLMTSLTIVVLGPGYLVRAIFHFLKNPLVVSVDYFHLVEWMEYFDLVESFEYFDLVESFEYFDMVESFEYFDLVNSFKYFPAQKHF